MEGPGPWLLPAFADWWLHGFSGTARLASMEKLSPGGPGREESVRSAPRKQDSALAFLWFVCGGGGVGGVHTGSSVTSNLIL